MNFKRWSHTKPILLEVRLSKIIEEAGEVAQAMFAYRDAQNSKNPGKAGVKARRKHLIEELEHVEFQAKEMRKAIEWDHSL